MEFLNEMGFSILMAFVCISVILFILGKFGFKIIKGILFGLLISISFSALLYYKVHLPIETVSIIGIVLFILGAFLGKIK